MALTDARMLAALLRPVGESPVATRSRATSAACCADIAPEPNRPGFDDGMLTSEPDAIEAAVNAVLDEGHRTADLGDPVGSGTACGTEAMTDLVLAKLAD